MDVTKTERGFGIVEHPVYTGKGEVTRLVQESSAIGDDADGPDNPGSSYLWVGKNHHPNRDEVRELAGILAAWLETGQLAKDEVT